MGYTPIPCRPRRRPTEAELRDQIRRWRYSRSATKRKRAHDACLELLRRHEVALGERRDPFLTLADVLSSFAPRPPANPYTRSTA